MNSQQQTSVWFDAIGRFFRWWRGELFELLPVSIRRSWTGAQSSLHVYLEEDGVRYTRRADGVEGGGGDIIDLQLLERQNTPVIVHVPMLTTLSRQLLLPAATRESLHQVLGFEMDRQTPFKAEQVYYAFKLNKQGSSKEMINVTLSLVTKNKIYQALTDLADWGLQQQQTELDTKTGDLSIRFHAEEYNFGVAIQSRLLPLLVTAGLLLVIMALPFWKQNEQLQILQEQLDKARETTSEAQLVQTSMDQHSARLQFLYDKQHQSPRVLEILDELSQLLPDSTWLKHLEIRQGRVHIQGVSSAASSLFAILEDSEYFVHARLESPITPDRSGQLENFQIAVDIATGYRQ